jgi:regulator of replication initiation timing
MPAHSSYILQPLDVGCFSSLKQVYSWQIEEMIQAQITYISKDDFFPAFYTVFNIAMTKSNIQGRFRGSGLFPFDPERVISTLDLKLKMPTPPNSRPSTAQPWVSQTPNNPTEALSQTAFIKNRIFQHQNSSPTSIFEAVDQFAKGISKIVHQLVLLKAENQSLRQANEALSKCRRAKKIRLRQGESLSQQEAQDLQDDRDVGEQVKQEMKTSSSRKLREESRAWHCGNCRETGYNARTCKTIEEISEEEDSE